MPVEQWGAVYNTEMGIGFLRPLLFLASLARTGCSGLKHGELSLWLPGVFPLTGFLCPGILWEASSRPLTVAFADLVEV